MQTIAFMIFFFKRIRYKETHHPHESKRTIKIKVPLLKVKAVLCCHESPLIWKALVKYWYFMYTLIKDCLWPVLQLWLFFRIVQWVYYLLCFQFWVVAVVFFEGLCRWRSC